MRYIFKYIFLQRDINSQLTPFFSFFQCATEKSQGFVILTEPYFIIETLLISLNRKREHTIHYFIRGQQYSDQDL